MSKEIDKFSSEGIFSVNTKKVIGLLLWTKFQFLLKNRMPFQIFEQALENLITAAYVFFSHRISRKSQLGFGFSAK